MLYLGGITLTLFLVFILLSKKDKSSADKLLTLWLFLTGVHLFFFYVRNTQQHLHFPHLLGIEISMPLLHGPFLFLYTSTLTNQQQSWKINLLHFLPYALSLLSLIPFFRLSSQQKIYVYQNEGVGFKLLMTIFLFAFIISGILYSILSLLKLSKHRKNIADQFSFTEKINLLWLRNLTLGLSLIWLIVIFGDDKHVFTAVVGYVFFIGYFGINQLGIFTNKPPSLSGTTNQPLSAPQITQEESKALQAPADSKVKYQKSGLDSEKQKAIHQQLTQLMLDQKLFKVPGLTLRDLAQKLDVQPNILSQVINTEEQKNFYDYINHQRIEEFKQLIKIPENQKFTLLALALECGFNSKTSFNRNFKKVTGISPAEYVKQQRITLQ
ncbi:MAG TPA: AraC family transcriptional regulator [Microscillaceae bacterium]|nr:AraC family transcriptional regulator [Microscillaceae bacterium]